MKLLAAVILVVGLLIAGSVVYAATRTTEVRIERTPKPAATACQFDCSGF